MNRRQIEKYAEAETQNGLSHQEIYNRIVSSSDANIHEVAEVVRKVPDLKKRKASKAINDLLLILLSIIIFSRLFRIVHPANGVDSAINLSLLAILIAIFFGIYKFKRNAQLVAGFFLLAHSLRLLGLFLSDGDFLILADLFVSITGTAVTFYLNKKLVSDYRLNKELLNSNPQQRKDAVIFID